jgi:hypothetical protein
LRYARQAAFLCMINIMNFEKLHFLWSTAQ